MLTLTLWTTLRTVVCPADVMLNGESKRSRAPGWLPTCSTRGSLVHSCCSSPAPLTGQWGTLVHMTAGSPWQGQTRQCSAAVSSSLSCLCSCRASVLASPTSGTGNCIRRADWGESPAACGTPQGTSVHASSPHSPRSTCRLTACESPGAAELARIALRRVLKPSSCADSAMVTRKCGNAASSSAQAGSQVVASVPSAPWQISISASATPLSLLTCTPRQGRVGFVPTAAAGGAAACSPPACA